ncbi:putative major facilitator superfamily domain-containing protein 6 [Apostichopus japonicus]|uniref:Putative major facilitator superfamily domain-containing protein 6 n=1 Tax=Stichopus japonicus TaxID=307972 RepID=A0A2G8JUK5_STIJA|nr:putative major facilitator superfamily domain-containing protein 6 [Apostichopus japonicus]
MTAAYGTSVALGAVYSSYKVQFAIDKAKELKRDGFFNLNKTFLPAKLFYFLFMGSMVTFLPFVPVYMEQLGLSSFQIGIVRTVQPVAHVTPTVDSNVMLLLKDFPDTDYGRQRLWGAAGWGSFAAITGLAMDTYIKYVPDGNRFLPAYIIFLALMIPAVIPVSLMRFPKHTQPESISGGIWKLFKSLKVIIFFTVAGVGGLSLGVINTFQFLFLNDLNAPSLVMGLTLTFTCLSEIPFMFAAGRIIKWTGEETVFAMALACYTLRFFLYAILRNPWLILPIELLHGICFGAMWPAMTSFANKVAPPGMGATVQNLVSAVSMGAGRSIGSIVGGYIYNTYGARTLFWDCGYLCAGTTVLLIFYTFIEAVRARGRRRTPTSYDEI